MSVATRSKAEIGNLMGLVDRGDDHALAQTIDLVDRLMIGMIQHRPHDRAHCKVWTEEGYSYLSATGATLRLIRDSYDRFVVSQLVAVDRVHEAEYQ